jgi:hypothetical protein
MPGNHKLTRLMLCAAVAAPLLYFGVRLIAAPCYTGYSFATDTASVLGTAASRDPGIFNNGAILVVSRDFSEQPGYPLAFPAWQAGGFEPRSPLVCSAMASCRSKRGYSRCLIRDMLRGNSCFSPILITPLLMRASSWWTSVWLRVYLLVDIVCLLLTLPMMTGRMAPIWPERAMQRLFAFVAMVPIGIVAFVVLRKRQSWERALIQNRINA